MALETHPNGSKGMDKENLSGVAGVEVEIEKAKRYYDGKGRRGEGRDKEKQKRYKDEVGSRGQGRGKEKQSIRFLFEKENKKIRGPTRSEVRTSTVPRQRRQKACWVF